MQKIKAMQVTPMSGVTQEELALINTYTRKELSEEEVYTFSVVLCDNDIDRDYECFSNEALEEMAKLFVGVTGIYDHNPSAKNQIARIYKCSVESSGERLTSYGAEYRRLVAKAYIPVCSASEDVISMLDAGIQKEVSVGCSMEECICSICGESLKKGFCEHIKGREYNGKLCYGILSEAADAYEWSFTAVPSQRRAGVIKSFLDSDSILSKRAAEDGTFTFTKEELERVRTYIENLKKESEQSKKYKSALALETVKSAVTAKTEIDSDLLEAMVKGLSIDELLRLKKTFDAKAARILPVHSQFAGAADRNKDTLPGGRNSQYEI